MQADSDDAADWEAFERDLELEEEEVPTVWKNHGNMKLKVACYPNGKRQLLSTSKLCCSRLDDAFHDIFFRFSMNILEQTTDLPPIFIKAGEPIDDCPFCGTIFREKACNIQFISDIEELAGYLSISSCDFCSQENRVVTPLYDGGEENGVHVMDICKFGCDDELSNAAWLKGSLAFQVEEIRRLELGYMDSSWFVRIRDSDGKVSERTFTRRNTESEEQLRGEIEGCTAYHEISRLELRFRINYD